MPLLGFICNSCNKYINCEEHGLTSSSFCPSCSHEEIKNDIQINVFKDGDVEIGAGNEKVHIGSRRDRREAEKRYGIAPVEEIKARAKEAATRNKKEYSLSSSQKELNSYIKRHGVNATLYDRHPMMQKVFKNRGR